MLLTVISEMLGEQKLFRIWYFRRKTDPGWIKVDFSTTTKYGVDKREALLRIREAYNIDKKQAIQVSPGHPPRIEP